MVTMMNSLKWTVLAIAATVTLSGCVTRGLVPAKMDGTQVIATGIDSGYDAGVFRNGRAAIAYDPDGCQNWLLDDGMEGYSSPRYDPVSGLPICNDLYPPGTVLHDYETRKSILNDEVPGKNFRKTVVVKR